MDSAEIAHVFDDNAQIDETKYVHSHWGYLPDSNNGSYGSGQIKFNIPVTSDWSVLRDSSLCMGLTVKSSGTAYTAATKLAVKTSLLSLIQGVYIATADGTTIVNENSGSTGLCANLKLLLETSTDFLKAGAPEIHFTGKDTKQALPAGLASLNSEVTSNTASIDPTTNQGLANRITIFQNSCQFDDGNSGSTNTLSFVCYIPLRYIHSFFANCESPLFNIPLNITFNINGTSSYTSIQPFTCPTIAAGSYLDSSTSVAAVAAVTSPDAPVVTITPRISEWVGPVGSKVTTGFTPDTCRLLLRYVKYDAATNEAIKNKIQAGYTKYIDYWVSDLTVKTNQAATTSATDWNTSQVASSVIAPKRVWVLVAPTGTMASHLNVFPSSVGNYLLSNVNLRIGNNNLYSEDLRSQYSLYQILAEQCPGQNLMTTAGSNLSYQDYLNGFNPICFDLTRSKTAVNGNTGVNIDMRSTIKTKSGSTAFDAHFLIERAMTMCFTFSTGGVRSVQKEGTVRA
jgi:hypothetical protein